MPNNCV